MLHKIIRIRLWLKRWIQKEIAIMDSIYKNAKCYIICPGGKLAPRVMLQLYRKPPLLHHGIIGNFLVDRKPNHSSPVSVHMKK